MALPSTYSQAKELCVVIDASGDLGSWGHESVVKKLSNNEVN